MGNKLENTARSLGTRVSPNTLSWNKDVTPDGIPTIASTMITKDRMSPLKSLFLLGWIFWIFGKQCPNPAYN